MVSLTVVKVKHSRVLGQARVQIGHERGDVLSGREHPVKYFSGVNETCKESNVQGLLVSCVHCREILPIIISLMEKI